MLVYLKEPMGYTTVGKYRVYGRYFDYGRYGPTDIPISLYRENRDVLEDATYTPEIVKEMFSVDIPAVSFRISMMHLVDFDILVEIACAFGIDYHVGRNKPSTSEKMALRRSVIARLTN